MSRTVNEIKKEILDFFRNLPIPAQPDQFIHTQILRRYFEGLNQQEQNNFDKAIQKMKDDDLIKTSIAASGLEIQITKKGIEYIES